MDPLTGAETRDAFNQRLNVEFASARLANSNLAVLLIDVDMMQSINLDLGHSVGDEILQNIVKNLNKTILTNYKMYRIGGDEFAVVLVDKTYEQAVEIADLYRNCIQDDNCFPRPVTVSIGGAILNSTVTQVFDLMRRADSALWQAKSNGRNCVVFASQGD